MKPPQTEPPWREFLVSINEPTPSMNNRHKLYTAADHPSDRNWLRVIEHSALLAAQEEIEKLKAYEKHIRRRNPLLEEHSRIKVELAAAQSEIAELKELVKSYVDRDLPEDHISAVRLLLEYEKIKNQKLTAQIEEALSVLSAAKQTLQIAGLPYEFIKPIIAKLEDKK